MSQSDGACVDLKVATLVAAQTPTTFDCFLKLAPELQIKIWKICLPKGQVINIHGDGSIKSCVHTLPIIFHVCFLSRQIAAEEYKPLFKQIDNASDTLPLMYMSSKVDILMFEYPDEVNPDFLPLAASLQGPLCAIALDYAVFSKNSHVALPDGFVEACKGLEEIILYVDQTIWNDSQEERKGGHKENPGEELSFKPIPKDYDITSDAEKEVVRAIDEDLGYTRDWNLWVEDGEELLIPELQSELERQLSLALEEPLLTAMMVNYKMPKLSFRYLERIYSMMVGPRKGINLQEARM